MESNKLQNETFMGFPINKEELDEGFETLYWIEVNKEKIFLDKDDETDEFSIHFSHSVIICSKYNRFCDYEYHTCHGYDAGYIASSETIHGKTTYHCKHGVSKWLSNEEALILRPEYCQKIIDKIWITYKKE